MLRTLKSGNMLNIDAVVAITKKNDNLHARLATGDEVVIEPEDLELFKTDQDDQS